jgi:hypothetical protein
MKRHVRSVVAALAGAGAMVGLLSAGQAAAADRVPGPEATRGASESKQANNHVDAHVNAHVAGTEGGARSVEESSAPRRDETRDLQRDWRNAAGMDRAGWTPALTPFGWSRGTR